MHGLTAFDWLVIVGYLIGITFVGFYASYRTKTAASFFISDRKYGRLLLFFLTMGSSSHADQAVTVAAKTYTAGASGIWYQWLYLFATPFYWLLTPAIRRMRAVTISDFFECRYSRGTSSLYAVFGVVQMVVAIGLMLKGAGVMIEAVSSGSITEFYAIMIMTVLFVAYGIVGGLNSSIYTDVVQGTLMIVLSCMIFPFALSKLGGMSGLRQAIDNPEMFRIVASGEITAFFIAVISFNGLMGYFGQPNCMLTGAGKSDFECRMGFVSGLLVKRLLTVAWTLTGLCGVALYAGQKIDVDQVYGLIARDLLPQIGNGLLGLFIAAMLASMMGACNALMVTGSALLVENLYRPFLRAPRSDKHFMLMGRIASVFIVALAIFFAAKLGSLVTGLELFMKAAAVIGVAVWIGLGWRRATVAGVWAGTLAGAAVWLFTESISLGGYSWDFNARFASSLPSWMLWNDKLHLPWQMVMYLCTNFVVMVLVSLVTKPVDKDRLDSFYACMRTPVTGVEPETAPFTLPPGIEPAPRRVLFDHPDFEIPVPSRASVVGFIAVCAIVVAMIYGGYWVFGLGQ
jgi:Na+/proline symporter